MATAPVRPAARQELRQAPGPRGRPIVGSLPALERQGMLPFFLDLWRRYGDTVRVKMGPIVQHLVVDPADVHHVLVANHRNYVKGFGFRKLKLALGEGLFLSEGPLWQRQRRLMQPPFTSKGVLDFAAAMTRSTEVMLTRWEAAARDGQPLDVNQEMARLAMDIIAQTMFDFPIGDEAYETAEAFRYVLEFVSQRSLRIVDWPMFVPTPANRRFKRALAALDAFTGQMIAQRRRRADEAPRDLLTMLIQARDEETGAGMSEQQLRDEVLTIFFAGHETTAQALTWTWYLLSRTPRVEQRLHDELESVLSGRLPTAADLPQLSYTRMVFEEAMRLYPPVLMLARDAIGPDELGGYEIPAGSMIVLSQYITHRHPRYWDEPDEFEPERFRPEAVAARPNYAYFPFGGGPRTCLGDKFAMLEGVLVLASVAQRYRLRLVKGHRVEPVSIGTLRPRYGMQMTLERR